VTSGAIGSGVRAMVTSTKAIDAVAILFTDVEGSTELMSREGDAVAGEVLRIHEAIVRDRLREWGGRRVGFRGDGFMASFRKPLSALRCAMEIQRALEEHNRAAARSVRVRIGLHLGFVREVGGQLYGQAVHAAARVMGEAAGGEIFVSEAIVRACRDEAGLSFADRGLFWLKGFQERWRLYEVEWRDRDALPAVATTAERAMTPFVARDVERADLRRAVGSALAGEGGLAFVTGEAGVGKTRLTDEIAAEAEARGMRVFAGHSAELEGGEAYLPFVEILERALVGPESPIVLRDALGESAPEIARLVPALRRVLPDLPPPLDLPPEQARRYLWSSMEEFLRRAAQDRPLLIALEDLHWADESSVQLLGYLAPLLKGMPVLVIGTYRDNEFGVTHPLAGLLNRLTRRRLATRIHLQRLPEDGVAAMIGGLAGEDPPGELVHAIYEETEGNPFFVEEVYLHLTETGTLFDADGRFRSDLGIAELDVPASVRLVVGERLARLSPLTRRTLVAAAVSGRVFEPAIVGLVAGLDAAQLAAVFDEAEGARVVVALPSDAAGARFGHELIRQTLIADTSAPARQMLHAQTADAIEKVHAQRVEDHAADLAFHLTRAGPGVDTARLIRYLRIAGDRAVETAAFEDAVAHLERALSLASERDHADRAQILERLAIARRSVGRWEDALGTMNDALDMYQRLGESDAVGRLAWWMVYQLAWAARFQDAVTVAQRGLGLLGDVVNPDRARLLSVTGWVVGLSGDHASAVGLFAAARSLADQLEDPRVRADVRHMEALQHMGYVEFQQGIEAGRDAARVFEDDGDLWQLCGVLAFVQFQLGTILRADDAIALADRVAELAQRLGHLGAQFLSVADSIRRDGVMAGDLGVIEELARREIEICRRGNLPWLYTGHLYLGLASHWAGRWGDAERELRTALELEPPGAFSGQSAAQLALHLAELGRAREVVELYEGARDRLPVAGRVHGLGAWNALLGFTEALYVAGYGDRAGGLYPMVEEALALGEWITFDCRLVRTRAGIAAAAARRWDEAERHYDLALEKAISIGNRIEQADIHRLRARMHAERGHEGDVERATTLIAASARRYRDLGMTALAERIETSLARTGLAHASG
jgi:class 3 adenylate cyclase/tetratricopeptide (TPR) repeat protein